MRSPNPYCVDLSSQHQSIHAFLGGLIYSCPTWKLLSASAQEMQKASNMSQGFFVVSIRECIQFTLPETIQRSACSDAFPSTDFPPWHAFPSLMFVRIRSGRRQSPVIPAAPRLSNHFTASINSYQNTAAAGSPSKKMPLLGEDNCKLLYSPASGIPCSLESKLPSRHLTLHVLFLIHYTIIHPKCERM